MSTFPKQKELNNKHTFRIGEEDREDWRGEEEHTGERDKMRGEEEHAGDTRRIGDQRRSAQGTKVEVPPMPAELARVSGGRNVPFS